MPPAFTRLLPQPALAAILGSIAVGALAGAWLLTPDTAHVQSGHALLAIALGMAVVVAYLFSIQISKGLKVEMTTVPLYLLAVLLPSVPLAATTGGLAVLTAELVVRARRENLYSDVISAAARAAIVVLAAATVGHLVALESVARLLGAALVMLALDALTIPVVVAPMSGERPFKVLSAVYGDGMLAEGTQYLLGLLGALAANVQILALLLLVPPTVLVYLAFHRAHAMQVGTRLMLERMADAVDMRDPYTGGHSRRVAERCAALLQELKLDGPDADLIVSVARIHDIGKIGIPDAILRKADGLTPDEQAIMQTHAEQGAELLARYPELARGVEIVRHHHENWDGSGYPQGLRGAAIPFGARLIAVADSFDAMTSDRPYRPALAAERAVALMREGRGVQWDPALVDALLLAVTREQGRRPVLVKLVPSSERERSA